MDYKYIEQLLERYWNCETSVEEEQILRIFFCQKDVPAHLLRYKDVFVYQQTEKEEKLGSDFDERILAEIERPVVKAKRLTMRSRFMPLFKAAAVVVMLFAIGGIVKESAGEATNGVVYVYDDAFNNRASDPQVAYEADTAKVPVKVADKPRIAVPKQ